MSSTPLQRRLIGSDPNQVPRNGMLGRMAWADPDNMPPMKSVLQVKEDGTISDLPIDPVICGMLF
jgi:hypothetical protein